jgi:hypothetical protein
MHPSERPHTHTLCRAAADVVLFLLLSWSRATAQYHTPLVPVLLPTHLQAAAWTTLSKTWRL